MGVSVDLVTEKGFKPLARRQVEEDLIMSLDWLLHLDDLIDSAKKKGAESQSV